MVKIKNLFLDQLHSLGFITFETSTNNLENALNTNKCFSIVNFFNILDFKF
jgi:hypothetical protein